MSTQFEFIMQLYMMNLLQQQQQQQLAQQQQQQQPLLQQQQQLLQQQQQQLLQQQQQQQMHKREMEMDISSSTMTAATTIANEEQQQHQQMQLQQRQSSHNPRTQLRKNSHTTSKNTTNTITTTTTNTTTTNCSSSSSCITRSPNSNSNSSIAIQQQYQNQYHQQQLLLPPQPPPPPPNTQSHLSPLQQLLLGQMASSQPPMLAAAAAASTTTMTTNTTTNCTTLKTPPPYPPPLTTDALATSSNLLLTPTTPNSGLSAATALSLVAASKYANVMATAAASSQFLPIQQQQQLPFFPYTQINLASYNNSQPPIAASNFLQSSTVTSTPTDDEDAAKVDNEVDASTSQCVITEDVRRSMDESTSSLTSNGIEYICDTAASVDDDDDDKYRMQEAQDLTERREDRRRRECIEVGEAKEGKEEDENKDKDIDKDQDKDDDDDKVNDDGDAVERASIAKQQESDDDDDEDVEEEDEKPLATLLQSNAAARHFSGRSSIGIQNSSNPSVASSSVAYQTPTKQPADSTHYLSQQSSATSQDTGSSFTQLMETENCNMTPMTLAKTLLTPPPSSDQLQTTNNKKICLNQNMHTTIKNESMPLAAACAPGLGGSSTTVMGLSSISTLDAFLQNEDNLKNLHKVSSYLECENVLCRQENLREHFHCYDEPCQGKILSKKDDIIRHLKWHKKRKESLLLGFARFSSSDDCEPTYGAGCAYCWKQTHYHCVYEDCPKVYVSTSDVQMHANFHRKNSEIVQEGFRRFRAHENCKIEDCPFFGKKTSHYHCCREGCNHTFKNKADMDKHKSYHLRDYQLTQDGFKKILKTEACPFEGCKFSTVCNHIHCVREGCNFILHSSSQMISHKRKHDRLDGEQAYQNYKKQKDSSGEESPAAAMTTTTTTNPAAASNANTAANPNASATANSNTALHTTTPLSSLSADRFLARKRGRPPKKIELPSQTESKRIKLESNIEQPQTSAGAAASQLGFNNGASNSSHLSAAAATAAAGLFPPPPFMGNFNQATTAAAAAAAAQSLQMQDPNAPNVQLTHLMALFQLQNPLFYQNLYPGGMPANLANILGAAAVASVMPPANNNSSGRYGNNMPAYSGNGAPTGTTTIKSEFGDKPPNQQQQQQYKE